MSTPLSIRLSDEVKDEFKSLSEQTGMKQEDFVATLLAAFKEKQVETDTSSPVFRERAKVDQALAQVQRVVVGFLEIAHNDKDVAVVKAQGQVAKAQEEVVTLKEQVKKDEILQEELARHKAELEEKVASLEGQAKSLQALQDAWMEKENSLNARLADLDTEAKEARKLKSDIAEASAEIVQHKNRVALAEQKAKTDKESLTEIKTRLQNLEKALDQARLDLQTAKDVTNQQVVARSKAEEKAAAYQASLEETKSRVKDLENALETARTNLISIKDTANQEVVSLTQTHAEEKGGLITQLKYHTNKIAELERLLAEQTKASKETSTPVNKAKEKG